MPFQNPVLTIIGIALFQARMKQLFRVLYKETLKRYLYAEGTIAVLEEALRALMRRNKKLEAEILELRKLNEGLMKHVMVGGIIRETAS